MINIPYLLLLFCIIFGPFIAIFLFTLIINFKYPKIIKRTHSIKLLIDTLKLGCAFSVFWWSLFIFTNYWDSLEFLVMDFRGPYLNYLVFAFTFLIAVQMVALRQMNPKKIKYRVLLFIVSTTVYFEILITFIFWKLPIQ